MGKNAKLRKKRKLESLLHGDVSEDEREEEGVTLGNNSSSYNNDSNHMNKNINIYLQEDKIQNAISCLYYFSDNMNQYYLPQNKFVRKSLYNLIKEQKSKNFDPSAYGDRNPHLISDKCNFLEASRTFQALGDSLELFRSRDMKLFRRALHPIVRDTRLSKGDGDFNIGLIGEISNALNLQQWALAAVKLVELKQQSLIPKLGSLQRWVRQCDEANPKVGAIVLLGLIINLTNKVELALPLPERFLLDIFEPSKSHVCSYSEVISHVPPFCVSDIPICCRLKKPMQPEWSFNKDEFPVASIVAGKDRRPPSDLDMNIYGCTSNSFLFDSCSCAVDDIGLCRNITKTSVTGVPGAFLISNVLSRNECENFITAAESLGYYPDAVEGIDALVLIANNLLMEEIYGRVQKYLPQINIHGRVVAGINPRFRFFRYKPGAVYRPHIDGSWTVSGAINSELACDEDDEKHSYMTFLIYLNGEFSGGGTTFFMSSTSSESGNNTSRIVARSVEPVQGSVLCFPHGVVEGSLVHEGSAVIEGVKYVIRSDVMYENK